MDDLTTKVIGVLIALLVFIFVYAVFASVCVGCEILGAIFGFLAFVCVLAFFIETLKVFIQGIFKKTF